MEIGVSRTPSESEGERHTHVVVAERVAQLPLEGERGGGRKQGRDAALDRGHLLDERATSPSLGMQPHVSGDATPRRMAGVTLQSPSCRCAVQ